MPMFDFKCDDCKYQTEHFIYPDREIKKTCPKCRSGNYIRQMGVFRVNVEYSDTHEHDEHVINPAVAETYQQIGRESLDQDTNTLDNIFGSDKVKHTLAEKDD